MNDDLRDYDLKTDDPVADMEHAGGRSARWPWWVALLVVVLGVVIFLWFRKEPAPPAETAQQESQSTASTGETAATQESQLDFGDVPQLGQSDAWLRSVVGQISSHPQLAEWLVTPELIRGFVATVVNVAEGANPRPHLEAAIPAERFAVEDSAGEVFIDPASYARFDLLVDVIDSLDVEGTAELYAAIRPLCEQAYRDLGYPGDSFDATLERAVRRVLSVPLVEGPIEVEKKVTAYQFTDPSLEGLSPAGKQLVRLGPDNLRRLQDKVRALARAIGLEV